MTMLVYKKIDTNPKGFDNLLRYISEIPNI